MTLQLLSKQAGLSAAWKVIQRCWDLNLSKKVRTGYSMTLGTSITEDHVFLQIQPSVPGWVRGEIQDFITKLRRAGWRITKRHHYREGYTVPGNGLIEEARIPVYEIWVD